MHEFFLEMFERKSWNISNYEMPRMKITVLTSKYLILAEAMEHGAFGALLISISGVSTFAILKF